jgi:hypothetical protein
MMPADPPLQSGWWPVGAAAAVPVLLCTAILGIETFRAAGWVETELSLSDAIAHQDFAQAIRRIEAGENGTVAYPVGENGRGVPVGSRTPVEVAVWLQKSDLVEVLLGHGVTIDARDRQRLICVAVRGGDERTAELLAGRPFEELVCD